MCQCYSSARSLLFRLERQPNPHEKFEIASNVLNLNLVSNAPTIHNNNINNNQQQTQVLATPAVRRLCRDLSLDLGTLVAAGTAGAGIVGTGTSGRVLKGDVLGYAKANRIALPREVIITTTGAIFEDNVGTFGSSKGGGVDGRGESSNNTIDRAESLTTGLIGVDVSYSPPAPAAPFPTDQVAMSEVRGEVGGVSGVRSMEHRQGQQLQEQVPSVIEERVGRGRREMGTPAAVPIKGAWASYLQS